MDSLHRRIQQAHDSGDKDKTDELMAKCDDAECGDCAEICCPVGSRFHFHHDGCPACAEQSHD